jgi:hypothetical protein
LPVYGPWRSCRTHYKSRLGHYADRFTNLGVPLGARLQGDRLDWHGGFTYYLRATGTNERGQITAYVIEARPQHFSWKTSRSYLMTDDGTIHYTTENRPANIRDPVLSSGAVSLAPRHSLFTEDCCHSRAREA